MSESKTETLLDTERRDNIVCPYCGYVDRDSWDVYFGLGPEGDLVIDCGRCGRDMKVSKHCTITYTTEKIP